MNSPLPFPAALIEQAEALGARFALEAERYDRTGKAPIANFKTLQRTGLLSLVISREDGGFGGGLAQAQAVVGAIARGEPATALILAMHYAIHSAIARRAGWPDALARRLTRESLFGIALANALQVEPALGSPSRGGLPDTLARRTATGWSLSGHKLYATGIPILSWAIVLAHTDEAEPRVGSFAVPTGSPGLRIVETWNPIGMRATASHDLVLENVEIPLEHALKLTPAADGLQRDETVIAWYNGLTAAIYHGIAEAARDWLVKFLNERAPSSLGAPLATAPRIQEAVGAIEILLATNTELLRGHAHKVDGGEALHLGGALVKHVVVDNAVEVTLRALALSGNHGLARKNPLERHHRDALCGRVHAPQNDVIRGNAGRAALSARA
jgi:alkylation response protein AidB-like acyl-CoA dehydrogenase